MKARLQAAAEPLPSVMGIKNEYERLHPLIVVDVLKYLTRSVKYLTHSIKYRTYLSPLIENPFISHLQI